MVCSAFIFTFVLFLSTLQGHKSTEHEESDLSHSSSIAEMVYLSRLKNLLYTHLAEYVVQLQQKLDTTNFALKHMETQLRRFENHLKGNHWSRFRNLALIRHLHLDWPRWILFMKQTIGKHQQAQVQKYHRYQPKKQELHEVATAITRLQDAYRLLPKDIAEGLLNGRQYNATFSALDCYVLGLYAHREKFYHDSCRWLKLSLSKFDSGQVALYKLLGVSRAQIYQAYAASLEKLNRRAAAWSSLGKAVFLSPQDARLYQQWNSMKAHMFVPVQPQMKHRTNFAHFWKGCRDEYDPHMDMHCHYDAQTQPFLRLAPLKVEQIHLDPYMALYHDVVYDSEIEELKKLALPKLTRALTYNSTLRQSVYNPYRSAKSATLEDDLAAVTRKLNQRVIDMTGLDIVGSDLLQVINYGIGGHYNPHCDYFNFSANELHKRGDRIATVLFYLSDVTQGGATVFPRLQQTFSPIKGDALVWHNLDNALNLYPSTLHGSCPVLFGSKWIVTKWVYSLRQAFIRPCKAL